MGCSEFAINRWERGKREPSPKVLPAYLAVLERCERAINAKKAGESIVTIEKLARETRPTVTVDEAAAAIGIGRTMAWAQVRQGRFPVRTIKVGRRVVVPTAALRELLGITQTETR